MLFYSEKLFMVSGHLLKLELQTAPVERPSGRRAALGSGGNQLHDPWQVLTSPTQKQKQAQCSHLSFSREA